MEIIRTEHLLDENVGLEIIPDMDTLKKVMKKVIDHSSYTYCGEERTVRAVKEIFAEYRKNTEDLNGNS